MTEKYRKKPVEVEAMRYDKRNYRAALVFAPNVAGFDWLYEKLTLNTLEGEMTVSDGDYIIKGVQGEFYPCKPDIFHETYEPVTDHQPTFEVGEYYVVSDNLIAKVLDITDNGCAVKVYNPSNNKFWGSGLLYKSVWGQTRVPATAEKIAEFERAEHFAKYGDKSVKKTLTIPKYLNALALENHINFSQLLQKALREELQEVENNE